MNLKSFSARLKINLIAGITAIVFLVYFQQVVMADKMKEVALQLQYPFPYLYDETQEVAKAYDAACTPDFFIYNKNRELIYRGQLDDSRPGNEIPVTGKDIRHALDCLINQRPVPQLQRASIGCNIKWK